MGTRNIFEDSSVYLHGLARGEVRYAHRMLLNLGTKRFGVALAETEAALLAISDVPTLDQLAERMLDATSWDDLLSSK